jgi:type IV secretion system protein VirB1
MLPGLEMMASCPNLAVPAEVMRHVVQVESGANPFAIGVVGGHLVRQPQNLDEAVTTANMLETQGYNYSLGLAQINRVNFGKFGLDTPAKAFDVCANLSAGANILADCYRSAGGDWGKAFSCYYAGNFITGFVQGYVQKIYNSIMRSVQAAANPTAAGAIPVIPAGRAAYTAAMSAASLSPSLQTVAIRPSAVRHPQPTAAQRIAMRSLPLHNAASANTTPAATPAANGALTAVTQNDTGAITLQPRQPVTVRANSASDVFEPQVHGPQHRPPATANDPADVRQQTRDSAFVF